MYRVIWPLVSLPKFFDFCVYLFEGEVFLAAVTEVSHDGLLECFLSRAYGNTIICPCEYLVELTRF